MGAHVGSGLGLQDSGETGNSLGSHGILLVGLRDYQYVAELDPIAERYG